MGSRTNWEYEIAAAFSVAAIGRHVAVNDITSVKWQRPYSGVQWLQFGTMGGRGNVRYLYVNSHTNDKHIYNTHRIMFLHTPQIRTCTHISTYIHTHTATEIHIQRSAAVVSMVTAWSTSQSSDCKRGAPPKSSPKLMRIYGLDSPDKTTHHPRKQKPGQQQACALLPASLQ